MSDSRRVLDDDDPVAGPVVSGRGGPRLIEAWAAWSREAGMRLVGVPLNLTDEARTVLRGVDGGAVVDVVCVAAYRARLGDPDSVTRSDLEAAGPATALWLAGQGFAGCDERAVEALRVRVRVALDAVGAWPDDLTTFFDPVGERYWLMSGSASASATGRTSFELKLVAESGVCDRAITLDEVHSVVNRFAGRPSDRVRDRCSVGEWTVGDEMRAAAEGWGLFDTGRPPLVEVQCFDAPGVGEAELSGDTEAWDRVLDGILRGSPVHGRAFAVLLTYAPDEAANLVSYWTERCQQLSHHHRRPPAPAVPARGTARHRRRQPMGRTEPAQF